MSMPEERIAYKRSRFSTRLPAQRLYTPSHYWLWNVEPGIWRVGFTKFAARMLGEVVEFDFEVKSGDALEPGMVIGWLEGFKATSDVYACADGTFQAANAALEEDPALMHSRMYDEGWFYSFQSDAIPATAEILDVHAYVALLDQTIDKMQEHA